VTGYLCASSEINEIFFWVSTLLNNEEKRNQVTLAAYSKIQESFTWDSAISSYEEVFNRGIIGR